MTTDSSTKTPRPIVIEAASVSLAWARAIDEFERVSGTSIPSLVLSVTGFSAGVVVEDPVLREALDRLLAETGMWDVETAAFTIFPTEIWQISKLDRKELFVLYRDTLPRYQSMEKAHNGRGLYFERMTMFGSGPHEGNQLEFVIQQHNARKGVRRSMFQVSIFDPARDHVTNAQLGFPCLQHVTFLPLKSGLIVNAFYATQQLFERGYGNYLGLARLGAFMAREMGLEMARLNVYVGLAKLEGISKTDPRLRSIVQAAVSADR